MTHRLINGQTLPHPAMRTLRGLALTICCALVVLPFLGILFTSLSSQDSLAASGGFVLIPTSIDLTAYRAILSGGVATQAVLISLVVTTAGTAISLFASTLMAYALSVRFVVGRGVIVGLLVASLLFTPGLIPSYLVVRQVGLLDSLWSLILPTAINAFNVIVLRAFFMGIPSELVESAKIDGAGEWTIFRRIMLPLSRAVIAVIGLFYAVGYWNAFFNALLYINDTRKWPLPLVLRTYVINNTQLGAGDVNVDQLPPQPALQMAILVISIVPLLAAYPFLQRHFHKGLLTGAVKG
jgi:multiple sugar transport system permease protein/putative aldouronate transport system permease protein